MQQKSTWLTVYCSTLIHHGRVAYCFYLRWDQGKKSYTGLFKSQITDRVHAEVCCVGAALKCAKNLLKEIKVIGLTIHTDCTMTLDALTQFKQLGHLPTSDINFHYVVGFNTLLTPYKKTPFSAQRLKLKNDEWMKASMWRKLKNLGVSRK